MFKVLKYLIFISLSLCASISLAQDPDALKKALAVAGEDTSKLKLLVQLTEQCEINEIMSYATSAIKLADQLLVKQPSQNIKKRILSNKALALTNIGFFYRTSGDALKGLSYNEQSLKIQEEIGDKPGIATSLNNIGLIHYELGDIVKSFDYYERSLRLKEEIGDKQDMALSLNNIAYNYYMQGSLQKALDYYQKSLDIGKEFGNKHLIASTYNYMALIYGDRKEEAKGIDHFEKSLKLYEEIGDKKGISVVILNLGYMYRKKKEHEKELQFFEQSLKLNEEMGDQAGIASALNSIGELYLTTGNRSSNENFKPEISKDKKLLLALNYVERSLKLSKELGYPLHIRNATCTLYQIEEAMGKATEAFHHYKQFILYFDSLNNEQTRKASIKNQLKYEYEKKEAIIKEQQAKERAIAGEKSRFQQIIIVAVCFGLLLVVIFSGFIFRSLRTTRKQKIIIEEKQREILDSIHYAKKIQNALMTNENYIDKNLARLQNRS